MTSAELCAVRVASWARIKAGEGFLYVAEIVGTTRVKIGFALNPERRMRDPAGFNSTLPRRLLATIPGTFVQEQALHRALRDEQIVDGCPRKRSEIYPRSILSHPAIPEGLRARA